MCYLFCVCFLFTAASTGAATEEGDTESPLAVHVEEVADAEEDVQLEEGAEGDNVAGELDNNKTKKLM